jgi:Holliday junction resolvase RusA-like endonuclease
VPILNLRIDGNGVSGNHYKHPRTNCQGQYVTREALAFVKRVQAVALEAAAAIDWELPEYCRVDVSVCNIRYDRDNAVKVLYDALQGVAYPRDSRILDGAIRLVSDDAGPRYEVTVTPVHASQYGKASGKKKPPVISHDDWVVSMLCPF